MIDTLRDALERAQEHIRWVAQTVHQAHHHEEGMDDRLWVDCPKAVCRAALVESAAISFAVKRGETESVTNPVYSDDMRDNQGFGNVEADDAS